MPDLSTRISMLVDAAAPHIDVDALAQQLEAQSQSSATPSPVERRRPPNWAAATGAAVAVFILVGGFVWLIGGTGSDVIDEPTASTTVIASTTTVDPATSTTVRIEPLGWNTVLADTRAKVPPTAATCPPSATPEIPGPTDQARPHARWRSNLAGAFDQHAGRIVYVDTAGETWTFDVCANTWHQMNSGSRPAPDEALYDAAGAPSGVLGQLVYDIDSDVTISLGYGGVSVYDANTNTWSEQGDPPMEFGMLGAVYDPISGRVITSTQQRGDDWDLWTYDVDTDEWALLGTVTAERGTPCCSQIDLLGYSATIDSLILTTSIGSDPTTILINPRTGDTTLIPSDEPTALVDLGWPNHSYGPGGDTVYVYQQPTAMARFDSATLTWVMIETPAEVPNRYLAFGAVVDDPINNRLILINGIHGDWWSDATNDIWAIDIASGQWTQILAPLSE